MEGMVIFFMTSRIDMKNEYRFEALEKIELGPNENIEQISLMMLNPVLSGNFTQVLDSLTKLRPFITSDCYYVANNHFITKGKKKIFRGELCKSQKSDLLSFLDNAEASGDLRELLITPVESYPNGNIIYITEDATYLYTTA